MYKYYQNTAVISLINFHGFMFVVCCKTFREKSNTIVNYRIQMSSNVNEQHLNCNLLIYYRSDSRRKHIFATKKKSLQRQ